MSKPKMLAVPALGARKPVSIFMVVDLPAPFGPRKPSTSPVATWKDRSSTATREPKRLPRFLVSIMVPYLFRRPPPCPARAAKNAQGL